jgi:hypothetical protein
MALTNQFIGNYGPDQFIIVLSKGDFLHQVTGFADGTFVSMERLVPTSDPYIGAGSNSFMRTKRDVTAMNVTVTLHQGSPSNLVLSRLQQADANVVDNSWVFNCTIKDPTGQTVLSSNNAIIAAPASAAFSTTADTRDWSIFMFGSDITIGGNMPLSDQEVASVAALGFDVEDRWKVSNQ